MRRSSRSRLVTAVGACAAMTLALPAAAGAAATAPQAPRSSEMPIPAGTLSAAAAGAERTTRVLHPRRPFTVLGARWRAGAAPRIEVRARRLHGGWTPWAPLGAPDGGGPAQPRVTAPALFGGGADAFQLRMSRRPTDLRVSLIDTLGAASNARAARARGARGPRLARAGRGAPPIISRSAWDPHNRCRPRTSPSYGRVDFGVVHHTEEPGSDYTRADVPALILGVCLYHRDTQGWNDIGYNFVVDKFGDIYEGRAGGVRRPVIGAQAQGVNSISTGVVALGSYTDERLSKPGIRAIARVLAWKLPLHGVPVTGSLTVTTGGGPLSGKRAGERLHIARISGHRDVDATDCPGNDLYAQLREIRALAARDAQGTGGADRAGLTLRARRTTAIAGRGLTLQGRLRGPGGIPAPSQPITVLRRLADGSQRPEAVAVTAADGRWRARVTPLRDAIYSAVYAPAAPLGGGAGEDGEPAGATRAGAGGGAPATQPQAPATQPPAGAPGGDAAPLAPPARLISDPLAILVRARVTIAPGPAGGARAGRAFVLRGDVTPAKRTLRVTLARRDRGRWRGERRLAIRTHDHGSYRVRLRPRRGGSYRVTVRSRGGPVNESGSARRRVHVAG